MNILLVKRVKLDSDVYTIENQSKYNQRDFISPDTNQGQYLGSVIHSWITTPKKILYKAFINFFDDKFFKNNQKTMHKCFS